MSNEGMNWREYSKMAEEEEVIEDIMKVEEGDEHHHTDRKD